MKRVRLGCWLGMVLMLSGCTTYGSLMTSAIDDVQQGQYSASETKIKKALKPTGDDRLLYFLELAVVKHLQNDFAASNALLEQAILIADALQTTSLRNSLMAMMSNPRMEPYAGGEYEKVFMHYYKALNYFGLAQNAPNNDARLDALEGARVEARRLIIRLNNLRSLKGNYADQESEEEQTFAGVLGIFNKVLRGNLVDLNAIQYREDAMAHYLTGISFEMNGDYDDARISYHKAAQAYESGYRQQYRLDEDITRQAWFDTVRMMRRIGGFNDEWPRLAQQKLTAAQRAELEQWSRDRAQLIVIEHKGLMPHRKELDLHLTLNPAIHSLQLRPLLFGDDINKQAWFYTLYADKGVAGVVTSYLDAVHLGLPLYGFTKTLYLGPLWDQAQKLGLISAIGDSGLRVSVPYYDPVEALPRSTLRVNEQAYPMLKSANPALMGVQEQMVRASLDIQTGLARAALKAISAQQLSNVGGDYAPLLAFVGKLTMQLTEAAETRHWLLLPQDIRIRRVALPPGEHVVALESPGPQGVVRAEQRFVLAPGDIQFWRVRSLPVMSHSHSTLDTLAQSAQ